MDLTSYILSSTDKSLRNEHFDDFLQVYYSSLAAMIRRCGSDPEKLFTFENMQQQLSQFGVYGILTTPMLLSIMVSDSKELVNIDEVAELINTGTTEDFYIAKFNQKSLAAYKERLSDAIGDSKKYGWS